MSGFLSRKVLIISVLLHKYLASGIYSIGTIETVAKQIRVINSIDVFARASLGEGHYEVDGVG